jgi:hypothetical protein
MKENHLFDEESKIKDFLYKKKKYFLKKEVEKKKEKENFLKKLNF